MASQEIFGTTVNAANTNIFDISLVETLPPNSPFSKLMNTSGVQTTPPLSRGFLDGSAIQFSNQNLMHVCDFKWTFDFGINLGELVNPAAAIAQAITNAKNKAAAIIRAIMSKLIDEFRTAIKAILAILSLDPSGQISLSVSLAKDIVRKINAIVKKIAQVIEDIYVYVALVQEIQAIIAWIESLPERIKQLIQQCLAKFKQSLTQTIDNIKAIPGQIVGTTTNVINSFTQNMTSGLTQLQSSLTPSPGAGGSQVLNQETLNSLVTNPASPSDQQALSDFIKNSFPSTDQAKSSAKQSSLERP